MNKYEKFFGMPNVSKKDITKDELSEDERKIFELCKSASKIFKEYDMDVIISSFITLFRNLLLSFQDDSEFQKFIAKTMLKSFIDVISMVTSGSEFKSDE